MISTIKEYFLDEREFNAYQKEQNVRKLRRWSVRVGGC
jgi:hypothetical protein